MKYHFFFKIKKQHALAKLIEKKTRKNTFKKKKESHLQKHCHGVRYVFAFESREKKRKKKSWLSHAALRQ